MGEVSSPTRPPTAARRARPVDRTGRDPRNPWAPTAFARLARAHAAGIAGDASFAIGLAGSVFFSLDFDSARWRVLLYLVLTIAPFAVAAPLIGPALDRIKGGRRWIIVASMGFRALLAFLVVRHLDSLLFYPEAFGMLVLGKVYTISKSAVVPGTVRTDTELIEANSKLTVLSAVVTVLAAAPAGALLALGGAQWTVGFSAVMFVVATVFAFRLAPTTVAEEPAGEAEKEELRSAGIFLAGGAMALVRGVVGFLSFLLAFAFKDDGADLWQLGVVAATAQVGFFVGAVVAPRLRRLAAEERILVGTLVVTTLGGLGAAVLGGIVGSALLSMLVGATGGVAKQAFDAILQRDAPDANRGRSFARFETRFQLIWVLGAIVPIIVPIPARAGFVVIAAATGATAVWYLLGLRRIAQGKVPVRRRGWRLRPLFGPGGRQRGAEADPEAVHAADEPVPPPPTADPTVPLAPEAPTGPHGGLADPTVVERTTPLDPLLRAPGAPGAPTPHTTSVDPGAAAAPAAAAPSATAAAPTAVPGVVAPTAPVRVPGEAAGSAPSAPDHVPATPARPEADAAGSAPSHDDPAPVDPARRWMRRRQPAPAPAPLAGQGELFDTDTDTDTDADVAAPAGSPAAPERTQAPPADGDGVGAQLSGAEPAGAGPLLFGPEAWTDLPRPDDMEPGAGTPAPPATTPPD